MQVKEIVYMFLPSRGAWNLH